MRHEVRVTGWPYTSGMGAQRRGGVCMQAGVHVQQQCIDHPSPQHDEQIHAKIIVYPYDTKRVIVIQEQHHQDMCETLTTINSVVCIYEYRDQESRYEGLFLSPSSGRSILKEQNTKRRRQQ